MKNVLGKESFFFQFLRGFFWLLWKVFHAVAEESFLKWQKTDGYLMCKTEVHRHFLQFLCILVYESSTEKPHHNTFLQDKIHARRV